MPVPMRFPVPVHIGTYLAPGIEIYYPQIYGFSQRAAQERMNQSIQEAVHALSREQQAYQSGSGMTVMTGLFEIKMNERGVFSVTLSNYACTPPMAHGMTLLTSLTFDAATGMPATLASLFRPGADYVEKLSELIAVQIKERNVPLLGEFRRIDPEQPFYLADKTLVIYYGLYELTPYVYGFPMFPISVYDVQEIAAEEGLLGRMIPGV